MTVRSKGRRPLASIAAALAALAVALLPLSPAHAAYGPDQPVYVQLNATGGYGALALLEGTVAFDDGNTRYRYALRLCWQHAYPAPYFQIYVNGANQTWPVDTGSTTAPGCQRVFLYNAEVEFGSTVQNVRFDVTGGWFSSSGYQMRTRSSITYDNPFN
ncbi:hypothetical protein OUY22_26275 [Nonomuraea sp. MCN248]|uniref:Secreted protein n=1 Tax=Nonomuraea corallina TaxID=2989783 RepID=A0ABT4SI97_9ACTN|nr:hypothetical protein [Nonomuraea corallina]MDA0636929.1 hypothetical protein [Nonomuraea corallina]